AIEILDQPANYWNDKRQKRVNGTLRFVASTFDSRKCNASSARPDLDLDKYTAIFVHRYSDRTFDPAKLSAFVSALEWSLDHQDRGDGSVPRNRIAKLSGLSNDQCYKLARFVVREGIFRCNLSDYGQNQARRWKIGNNFPSREWWRIKQ